MTIENFNIDSKTKYTDRQKKWDTKKNNIILKSLLQN
jgi:hypothetical protein